MEKALILGGGGYVGTVLADYLLQAGYKVTILDTFEFGTDQLFHLSKKPNIRFVKGDVRNTLDIAFHVSESDVIFNLAAVVGFPACAKDPRRSFETTVTGTYNLCGLITTKQLVFFASTGSVYGKVEAICSEDVPCNPQSIYGQHKYEAEKISLDHNCVALRFATLFGMSPCMRFDLLPNAFTWRAIKQKYIVLYQGSDRRTFLSVDDACRAYLQCLTVSPKRIQGEFFNVGDESMNLTKRELAQAINKLYPFQLIEEKIGVDPDLRDYTVSYAKFREATGFEPVRGLSEVLTEMGNVVSVSNLQAPWRFDI